MVAPNPLDPLSPLVLVLSIAEHPAKRTTAMVKVKFFMMGLGNFFDRLPAFSDLR
jgi:hypothetical protein